MAGKNAVVAVRDALIISLERKIKDYEELDEKRAKKEFTLRGEIAELERKLGIKS